MLKNLINGLAAGTLIAIGGSVYMSCDNKYIGAILFSVALLCICYKGYSLFTGKVGFMPEKHDREAWSVLLWGLLGNFIATVGFGLLIRYANTAIGAAAELACAAKLTQAVPQTLIRAFFCGILMYLAVSVYRDNKSTAGIFFCVPVFILSGFEHSIANMFYFGASGKFDLDVVIYLIIVIIGNAIGGVFLPLLSLVGNKEKKNG